MSQVEIRVADDSASTPERETPSSSEETLPKLHFSTPSRIGPIIWASLATFLWLGLWAAAFGVETQWGATVQLEINEVLTWAVTSLLPIGIIWLITFSLLQTRALRASASALQHNFAAFTFPTEEAQRRFSTVINTLRQQTRDLGRASREANERIQGMESLFREQTTRLQHAGELAEERTGRIKAMLDRQEAGLASIADQVGEKAKVVQSVVADGSRALARTTEDMSEQARTASDLLTKQSDELNKAAANATSQTADVGKTIARSVSAFDTASQTARNTAEALDSSYAEQIQSLEKHAGILSENTGQLQEALKKEVASLGTAGEQATARARVIEETVRSHADQMNAIVGQVSQQAGAAASQFQESISNTKETARAALVDLRDGTVEAAGQIEEAGRSFVDHAASLRATADVAASDLTKAGTQLHDNANAVLSSWRGATEHTVRAAEDSFKILTTRADEARRTAEAIREQMLEQVGVAKERMEEAADSVTTAADGAVNQTNMAKVALVQARSDLEAAGADSEQALARSGETLQDQAAELRAAAADATKDAYEAGAIYRDETRRFSDATAEAKQNTEELQTQLLALSGQLQELATHIDEKSKEVETRTNTQLESWRATSNQTADDVRRMERAFGASAEGLVTASQSAGERIMTAGRDILEKVELLKTTSKFGVASLGDAVVSFEVGAKAVAESSNAALTRLAGVRATLDEHDGAAQAAADSSAERLKKIGDSLGTITAKISEVSDIATGRLTEATSSMQQRGEDAEAISQKALEAVNAVTEAFKLRLEELGVSATQTSSEIAQGSAVFQKANDSMSRNIVQFKEQTAAISAGAQQMVDAAVQVSDRASKADHVFEARAQRLLRSADQLSETIQALEELEQETTQGAFLRTANNIMETLGSLAVDIDRIVEVDVPDKVWRQYRAGDSGVFARRLVKMTGRSTRKKIADKYRREAEFRDHVLRYLRQFESLLKRAMSVERSDALAATLLSSNMGKLYVLLAQSLNRLH